MNTQLLASLSWQELPILIFALLLALVFFLVIRQNQKEIEDFAEKPGFCSEDSIGLQGKAA
jgi:hypothetical protein